MAGTKGQEFDQAGKHADQVFGFVLCNKFNLKAETLLQKSSRCALAQACLRR